MQQKNQINIQQCKLTYVQQSQIRQTYKKHQSKKKYKTSNQSKNTNQKTYNIQVENYTSQRKKHKSEKNHIAYKSEKNQKYIQHTNRTFNSRKQDICTNNKLTKVKHTKNKYQTDIQHIKNRHTTYKNQTYNI